jgi:hypothetical protein
VTLRQARKVVETFRAFSLVLPIRRTPILRPLLDEL